MSKKERAWSVGHGVWSKEYMKLTVVNIVNIVDGRFSDEDVQKGHDSSMRFQYLNFVSDRYPNKLASIFLFGHLPVTRH